MSEEISAPLIDPNNFVELDSTVSKEETDQPQQERAERQEADSEDRPAKKGPKYWTKDEWEAAGKDPGKYKSKEQFEKDGEFFEKIEKQNKLIKKLENRLYQEDKQRHEYRKQELENLRFQAISERDTLGVYTLDEEIRRHQAYEPPEPENEDIRDYKSKVEKADRGFEERNKTWISEKSFEADEMREHAQNLVEKLRDRIQTMQMDPEDVIEMVEKDLQRKFPHRFKGDSDWEDGYEDDSNEISKELKQLREELKELKEPKKYASVEAGSYTKSRVTARDIPSEYRDAYVNMPESERKNMPIGKYLKMVENIKKNRGAIEI